MVQLPCPDEMSAWEPTGTGWSYWRPDLDVVVEVGTLRGNEVGLPAHLHRENQVVTFVVSGRTKMSDFDPYARQSDSRNSCGLSKTPITVRVQSDDEGVVPDCWRAPPLFATR
jgi:hypothetical protein